MNKDRGIIKWQPFNSIVDEKELINNLLKDRQKIKKPILSLEQQQKIEEELVEAYYEQIPVTLKIYKNGIIYQLTSIILNMDYTYKKITLKTGKIILFQQILEIVL